MSSTYDPNTYENRAPLAGNADFWVGSKGVWENHEAIYATHAPPILCQSRAMSDTNVLVQPWIRWRVRGNLDLHTIRWRGYLTPGGGVPSVLVGVGSVLTAANVVGTGYQDVDVTPVAGGVQDCVLYCDAPAPGLSLAMSQCRVSLVPAARITRQASGYVGDDEVTDTADFPICVEHLDRLERGPLLTARDRPHCAVAINPKIGSPIGGKVDGGWIGGNTTSTDIAGRAVLPPVDERPRRYIVDAFVAQSAAGAAAAEVRIGTWRWQPPAFGSWQSTEVVLPPGPLPITGSITADVGVWCQFQGLQVWRL